MDETPMKVISDGAVSLINTITRGLVDLPDKVIVSSYLGEKTVVISVTVDKSDVGKLIGKKGKNVAAVRDVLFAYSGKHRQRIVLEINNA